MKLKNVNTAELPFRKSVGFMLVSYWAVLVFWQNISGAETRGSADLAIKLVLILYFVWFYLHRVKTVGAKILWVMLLAVSLLITAFSEAEFPISNVIAYAYPIIFLSMVYGLGDKFEISKRHLIAFCNWIIVITLYAAIYGMVFLPEQFSGIFSVSQAYGNEVTSFFFSSHEYGMYLACAMVSCCICLKMDTGSSTTKKVFYIFAMAVLSLNLLFTFSRTSLLGVAVFLISYIFLGKGRLKRWILAIVVIAVIITIFSPEISQYLFRIVMKENTLSGRDDLLRSGIAYYRSGTFMKRIFGYGIHDTQIFLKYDLWHSSVHNAYLQILLYYGAVGLLFMLSFLISQLWESIRFIRQDRFWGSVSLGLVLMAMAMMFTNTAIVFTSPIDSYFLTIFMFVVPKYVRNAIRHRRFGDI